MQSEIPLNFILQKSKQLKGDRVEERKRERKANRRRERSNDKEFYTSTRSRNNMTKQEKINAVLNGRKPGRQEKKKNQVKRKNDGYDIYRN